MNPQCLCPKLLAAQIIATLLCVSNVINDILCQKRWSRSEWTRGYQERKCLICHSENLNSPPPVACRSKPCSVSQVSQHPGLFLWQVPATNHHISFAFLTLAHPFSHVLSGLPQRSSPRPLSCPVSVVDVMTSSNFLHYNLKSHMDLLVHLFLPNQTKFSQEIRLNYFPHCWVSSPLHLKQKTWKIVSKALWLFKI